VTALDALVSALRPSQAAEDVLSRLLAMGWEVVPAAEAGIGRELARVCRMFALEACEGSE
jgi:hypothetical protein